MYQKFIVADSNDIVLFTPLNWGLGHATRLVPVINGFLNKNCKVIIAANGEPLEFLKRQFKNVTFVTLPGAKITYGKKPFFVLKLLLQMPGFLFCTITEKYRVNKLVNEHKVTIIVSDNRYGCYNKRVKSIIITHQLFIKLKGALKIFSQFLPFVTKHLISKFNECWVPDFENFEQSLSGSLSHGKNLPKNVKYIGPLSRFAVASVPNITLFKNNYKVLALISGPEPEQTIFKQKLAKQLQNIGDNALIITAKNGGKAQYAQGCVTFLNNINDDLLYSYLLTTPKIICRCGYTSVMDFYTLKITAVWSATAGQTEQEYLLQHILAYHKNLFYKN